MRALSLLLVPLAALAAAQDAGAEAERSGLLPRMRGWIPEHLQAFIGDAHARHEAERRAYDAQRRQHNERLGLADDDDIEPRQAVAPGGGGAAPVAATPPTQVPTVTVFQLNGKAVPYTQKFEATPVPWPQPANGQIGWGTIKPPGS